MYIEKGTDNGANPMFLMEFMEITNLRDVIFVPYCITMQNVFQLFSPHLLAEKLKDLTEQIDPSLHKGERQAAKALLAQMKYFASIEDKVKEKLLELM
uniref:Co-chaperone HscB C-terminal oligomerisation domain-containing protein n=1 Tax=Oncorhynchus kisutch TaxID=8019 RepID=A0A8C7HMK8_ONCKI